MMTDDLPTLPRNVQMDMATMERMALTVAMTAARETVREMKDEHPTKDEMREIAEDAAEKAIVQFTKLAGIEDIGKFRDDLSAWRASNEVRKAVIQHGIKAVITVLVGGLCTAVWLYVKGAR